ncbi:PAS domain-containing protein [Coralliovum pocilloporae]|uniref:PAS domain-containing protein n=1 Tax=Coralliovum pocilloporae TaxID=3066369 RepID=UPI003306CF00
MKHTVTQELYEYWNSLRHGRLAPNRSEIEPSAIRNLLGDTFILEVVDRDTYNFRLAGTRLCGSYCRELKERNLLDLWTGHDREAVATLLATVSEDGAVATAGFSGRTERGQTLEFELILLPLMTDGENVTRILGAIVAHDTPYWLGIWPIIAQNLGSVSLIWPDDEPAFLRPMRAQAQAEMPLVITQQPSKRIGHLSVYQGGKT